MNNQLHEKIVNNDRSLVVYMSVGQQLVCEASASRQGVPLTTSTVDADDHWYFNRLFVKPQWRHRGLAKKILTRFTQLCADRRLVMLCDVNPYGDLDREQLMNLYRRFGFTDTKATAFDVEYDALVLDARRSDDNDQRGAC